MIDRLVVNVAPGEMRIALLHGERTVELHHHRAGRESVVGNIYLGRVKRLAPGTNGAFIDIGEERPGFLNAEPDCHGATAPIGRRAWQSSVAARRRPILSGNCAAVHGLPTGRQTLCLRPSFS